MCKYVFAGVRRCVNSYIKKVYHKEHSEITARRRREVVKGEGEGKRREKAIKSNIDNELVFHKY